MIFTSQHFGFLYFSTKLLYILRVNKHKAQGCQEPSFRIFYDKAADEVTDIVADRIDFTEQ